MKPIRSLCCRRGGDNCGVDLVLQALVPGSLGVLAEAPAADGALGVHEDDQPVALAGVAAEIDDRPAGAEIDLALRHTDDITHGHLEDLAVRIATFPAE